MNFKISLPSWAMGTGKEALVYVSESRLWNKQANKQQQQKNKQKQPTTYKQFFKKI